MIPVVATPATFEAVYECGPVRLELEFESDVLGKALHGLLAQYDAPWPDKKIIVRASVSHQVVVPESLPNGSYLRLAHLKVDRHGSSLASFGKLGTWMEFDLTQMSARITVPEHPDWPALVEEVEQQFVLLLARAWAACGWTPVHGGTLILPESERCVCLCAPSGVGKTTLTAAMLRRGWRTLGDDKMLVRIEGSRTVARSLARRFHLHPMSSRWFPEAGDITAWPTYSRWTDKRVVRIDKLWPGRFLEQAYPGAAVQLERDHTGPGITIEPLDRVGILNILLRQVTIPQNAEHARPLVSCIATAASAMKGALIKVGHDAFNDPAAVDKLDATFKELLS